jgi:hypothetical protein
MNPFRTTFRLPNAAEAANVARATGVRSPSGARTLIVMLQ